MWNCPQSALCQRAFRSSSVQPFRALDKRFWGKLIRQQVAFALPRRAYGNSKYALQFESMLMPLTCTDNLDINCQRDVVVTCVFFNGITGSNQQQHTQYEDFTQWRNNSISSLFKCLQWLVFTCSTKAPVCASHLWLLHLNHRAKPQCYETQKATYWCSEGIYRFFKDSSHHLDENKIFIKNRFLAKLWLFLIKTVCNWRLNTLYGDQFVQCRLLY